MKIPRLAGLWKRGKSPKAPFAGQGLKFYLGALALLLVGFVAGFYLFFPTSVLQQRLEAEIAGRTPMDVRIKSVSLLFPPGLQANGIRLTNSSPSTEFAIDRIRLAPLWRTMIGKNPGIVFNSTIMGGQVTGNLRKDGSLAANLQNVTFSAPVGGSLPIQLDGRVVKGDFAGALPLQSAAQTSLSLGFEQMRISGLAAVGLTEDSLVLGNVTLIGSGRGNALKIDRLSASGGNLEVTGDGTVMLAEPFDRSRLNLNLVLRPGQQLDKTLADLLEVFAQVQPDGTFRLRLTGSFRSMTIQ